MIKYVPFLKFKQNEIQGVAKLDAGILGQIVPLYDVPLSKKNMTEEDIDSRIRIACEHLDDSNEDGVNYPFFIDNFDVDDTIDLAGIPQYREILNRLAAYRVVPVLAFDRHADHNSAALDFITRKRGDIGIRLQIPDIESYALTKRNLLAIWPAIQAAQPTNIILLVDCRVVGDEVDLHRKIERFLAAFRQDFVVRATVVTGSVIPGNIADLIGTNEIKNVLRKEYRLWRSLQAVQGLDDILLGDYCVVSPEYSDIDLLPELMGGVATPKAFYAYDDQFYIARGRRFRTHGYQQYFGIADSIVGQVFYRGAPYSYGDDYVHERSHLSAARPAKGGSPSTWIRALTAAHITFIVNTI
ncbi:beta family protein [Pseudomonas sp. Pseusp97]|uniref:beta family protein n=1 Tax=Pseudomonas sp. Pseusp97 TaxID=3243065 RepID=UPI0039A4E98F